MIIRDFQTLKELEKNLDQVLLELRKTVVEDLEFKQAKLLTYWLNDWNEKFLKHEANFKPDGLIKYTRGHIVKLHLGFNIGSEQGGLHYGLVVDKNNDKTSPILTIIPLRSLKDGEKPESIPARFEYYLGHALLTPKIDYIEKEIEKISDSPNSYEQKKKKRHQKELDNLKKGSVAIVSQIRTISKMRIFEPIKGYHSLSSFVLEPGKLSDIDMMIKNLFIGD